MREVGPVFPTRGVPVIETVANAKFPWFMKFICEDS